MDAMDGGARVRGLLKLGARGPALDGLSGAGRVAGYLVGDVVTGLMLSLGDVVTLGYQFLSFLSGTKVLRIGKGVDVSPELPVGGRGRVVALP